MKRAAMISRVADDPQLDGVFEAIQEWSKAKMAGAPFEVRDRHWRNVVQRVIELKYPLDQPSPQLREAAEALLSSAAGSDEEWAALLALRAALKEPTP